MIKKLQMIGIALGVLSLALWVFMSFNQEFAEHVYARSIYPELARAISGMGNKIPYAVTGMLFSAIAFCFIFIPVIHFSGRSSKFSWVVPSLLSILAFAGLVFFLACITFLFNHHRYSEEKLYGLDFAFTDTHYQAVIAHSVPQANRLSLLLPKDQRGCTELEFYLKTYDVLVKREQTNFLDQNELPAMIEANTRYFHFSDVWSGMGVSGQYQPLVAQPNIAREIPDLSKPFVIAHERAHLNGFASEAGANLLAMQTLLHASMDRLRYLGLIELWRKSPPEGLNEAVQADLQCIKEDWEKVHRYDYDYLFTEINDIYLKMSGHKDGVGSYGRGKELALKYYYKYFVVKNMKD